MAKSSTTKTSANKIVAADKKTAVQSKTFQATGSSIRRLRKSFGRIHEVIGLPDLIEVQKNSYKQFLEQGLHDVLD